MPCHSGTWKARGAYQFRIAPTEKLEAPMLVRDRPWEAYMIGWPTLLYDQGRYRMWYEALDPAFRNDVDGRLCYAESDDCINWRKPELGLVDYHGSKKNNIVFDGAMSEGTGYGGGTVFIDPTAPSSERYKMIFSGSVLASCTKTLIAAVVEQAYSADGIHWKMKIPESKSRVSWMIYGSDTQTVVFWDPGQRKYIGFFRMWEPTYNRCISRAETNDFYSWPLPDTVLRPEEDELFTDLYNNCAVRYERHNEVGYFFFTSAYHHGRDTLHVQLATSRDTRIWNRSDRRAFIDNTPGSFDARQIYAGPGLVPLGPATLALAYAGSACPHEKHVVENAQRSDSGIGLVKIKQDRFQGLHAKSFEFAVAPFIPQTPSLDITVNADIARGGFIRVGIVSPGTNQFVDDASLEQCVPLTGDVLAEPVRWRTKPNFRDLVGRNVELRLQLSDATLYSVEVDA